MQRPSGKFKTLFMALSLCMESKFHLRQHLHLNLKFYGHGFLWNTILDVDIHWFLSHIYVFKSPIFICKSIFLITKNLSNGWYNLNKYLIYNCWPHFACFGGNFDFISVPFLNKCFYIYWIRWSYLNFVWS